MELAKQVHLNYIDTVNYGSYYTPEKLVNIVESMIRKNIFDIHKYKILDTSCGYGSFLKFDNSIGADIDYKALQITNNTKLSSVKLFNTNGLSNVDRKKYGLDNYEKIIVVGNPPYNDTKSIIRNNIKNYQLEVDSDIKSSDLGISFLLSYDKLCADYICILHPLSYLIKKANFEKLKNFKNNYLLKDSLIVSSGEFEATSKYTKFPIIIALYERNQIGMNYNFISNYKFKILDGKELTLSSFDVISNYITKYPNKKIVDIKDTVAYFWTMRDINALKRTKSFIEKESENTIRVVKEKLHYYCYVDVFKDYIKNIPYYLGNNEVMINHSDFIKIKSVFITRTLNKFNWIKYDKCVDKTEWDENILKQYFKNLLGEHFID